MSDKEEFGIYEVPMPQGAMPHTLAKIGWYTIEGFSDRGAPYRYVFDNEGTKLTYYRPANWTDEDWDEFCNEMEEEIVGDQAGNE